MSARKLAVQLLNRTEQEQSYSNLLLDSALSQSQLDERDKRLCASLYYGVIERRITLDAVLSHYSKQPLRKLDSTVRNILRLGIYQLLYCDQIPSRAAVSESVKETVLDALRCCKRKGIEVVCDLNYRAKMWDKNTAQCVMRELMPYVTLCIANDEDFEASLGIHAFDGDMSRGIEQIDTYREGMQEITRQFPNCKAVASVLRSMYTVEDGDWMAIYLIGDQFYETPVHHVHSLEAVGAGDAFAAALIHMLKKKENPQYTIDFSIAASVLKLMIQHDFNIVTEEDIIRVMKSNDVNLQR